MVYVLNFDGKPLMPCKEAKARKLLKNNKAKVVKREPFTIQLLWKCENNTQPITLGVDAGSKYIGLSAATEKKELYAVEVELRNDIVNLMSTRRENRRTRRGRLRELRVACGGKCEDFDVQPQDDWQDGHIGATTEEVKELLRRCGCKLGIDYGGT